MYHSYLRFFSDLFLKKRNEIFSKQKIKGKKLSYSFCWMMITVSFPENTLMTKPNWPEYIFEVIVQFVFYCSKHESK